MKRDQLLPADALPSDGQPRSYEHLDAALEVLSDYGPTLRDGLFNHAPMVVEALCAMGYAKRAVPWIAAHRAVLVHRPQSTAPIDGADWRRALGDPRRFADWAAYFRDAFENADWPAVLERWVLRLAPGFTTAACHGVIRAGHAARALAYRQTDARVRELADALAAWASQYRALPVAALTPRGELAPGDALRALPACPGRSPSASGLIDEAFAALRGHGAFPGAVARVDLSGEPASRVDELVRIFAGLFVGSAASPYTAVVFAHAVTAAAAVGNLCLSIGQTAAEVLTFRAWEAGCALAAAFGASVPNAARPGQPPIVAGELARRAVEHGDDHVIKLTEACLAAYRRHPAEVLLTAPARALALVPSPRQQLARR
jgi:hypothetical protein